MRRYLGLCWKKLIHWNGHTAVLSVTTAILLLLMCYGTSTYSVAQLYEQPNTNAVLATRIDQISGEQTDQKATIKALNEIVQSLRDRLNQMEGMLIGFGGFAALLQIINVFVQIKSGGGKHEND